MEDDSWANDVVPDVISIIEREGELRGDALCMTLSTLVTEWSNWGRADIERLLKIMAGRRLLTRIAGREGEELRMHPEAKRLHEVWLQRQVALEEEEEGAFIEEEIMAEEAMEGIIRNSSPRHDDVPEVVLEAPHDEADMTQRSNPADAYTPQARSIGGSSVEVPTKKTISNLKAMFAGQAVRVPSPADFSNAGGSNVTSPASTQPEHHNHTFRSTN